MTGFASTSFLVSDKNNNQATISIQLKSLNSRFFEHTLKLPYVLSHLETHIIKLLKSNLHRGHVFLIAYVNNAAIAQGKIEPAISTVKNYLKALEHIQKECRVPGTVEISDVIRLPNIFNIQEKELDPEVKQKIIEEIKNLIAHLNEVRETEGKAMAKDILERCDTISTEINKIEILAIDLLEKHKKHITQVLEELSEKGQEIDETYKNELYKELDKLDVHEEIIRFKTHLKTLKDIVRSQAKEKGRRLDFTLQELVREINTIASKCSSSEIGTYVINIKVELEKAREQAQNIV